MDAFGNIINVGVLIVGILGAFAGIGALLSSRYRYGLRWVYLPPRSMLEIAEEITSDLSISFKGSYISNLTQYQFILHNVGYAALKDTAIVTPLEWTSPGRILSYRVVGTDPPVELELKDDVITRPPKDQEKEYCLQISWLLLNQRCKAFIEVLCEGNPSEPQGRIKGQIENVPRIKEKKVVFGESKITYSIAAMVISGVILFGSLAGIKALAGPLDFDISAWQRYMMIILVSIGFPTIFAVANWLLHSFGNPYTRFIKKVKTSDHHPMGTQS